LDNTVYLQQARKERYPSDLTLAGFQPGTHPFLQCPGRHTNTAKTAFWCEHAWKPEPAWRYSETPGITIKRNRARQHCHRHVYCLPACCFQRARERQS